MINDNILGKWFRGSSSSNISKNINSENKKQHTTTTTTNSVLDCAYCWSFGVKVATFLWTWWKTRVVLPSMLAGFAGYDAPRAVFPSFVASRTAKYRTAQAVVRVFSLSLTT